MSRPPASSSRSPSTPPGAVVCAIGDIHGRLDLLEAATDELRRTAHRARVEGKAFVAVFLGDYVDRGPDSQGVIAHLMSFSHEDLGDIIFLRGNHEQVMLDLADGTQDPLPWLDYGGVETLQSYGIANPPRGPGATNAELGRLIRQSTPASHLEFLRHTQLYAKCGDYLFVHAGLRPDRLMEEQSVADMLWFRYYSDEAPVHGEFVVHGHSTNRHPILGRWRIGIDTEAYDSGKLTILRLDGQEREFLQVAAPEPESPPQVRPWPQLDASYVRTEAPKTDAGVAPRAEARRSRRVKAAPRLGPLAPVALVAGAAALAGLTLWAARRMAPPAPPEPAAALRPSADPRAEVVPPSPVALAPKAAEPAPAQSPASEPVALRPVAPAPAPPLKEVAPPKVVAPPKAKAAAEAPPKPLPSPRAAPPAGAARAQIGALDSEDLARSAWKTLGKSAPAAVRPYRLQIEQTRSGDRTFYRAYASGFSTVDEAKAFCRSLEAIKAPCIVKAAPRN